MTDVTRVSVSPPNFIAFVGPKGPVMTIRLDTEPVRIEIAEGVEVDDAAKTVIEALRTYIQAAIKGQAH